MNAEQLYQHIKDALSALGLGWNQKDKMTVSITGGEIAFSFENKTISIQV